jgi:DNA polymerase III epsilon subunit-like protein
MKWLIFDTETTDLITNSVIRDDYQPLIIEFYGALVNPDTGEIQAEYETLINPGFTITEEIQRITGIKPEDLVNQPKFSHVASDIKALIESADGVVAHNLSYDYAVVEGEMKRCAMQVEWPLRRICTVEETEWFKGFRLSLTALHEELFSEPFSGAHRARNDVAALVKCVVELRKRGDL